VSYNIVLPNKIAVVLWGEMGFGFSEIKDFPSFLLKKSLNSTRGETETLITR